MKSVLHDLGIDRVDGSCSDLGVSSYQLDTAERGFSYREDAPLDMRMDRRQQMTARDIVNDYSERDLYRVIRDYGEDKFAKNIAKHIAAARAKRPHRDNRRADGDHPGIHPDEIPEDVGTPGEAHLSGDPDRTEPGAGSAEGIRWDDHDRSAESGRKLCIITFHSLEDRIVKSAFRKNEDPCTCPKDFPVCVCGKVSKGSIITRKPILPGEDELRENSRSKSAKLRIFERK